MTTTIVREAVDALNHAFEEFKSANDDRLKAIEKKGSVDPLLEQKVNRLNQALDQASDRLGRIEVATGRPALAYEKSTFNRSAFSEYVCKGIETELEKKALSSVEEASGGYLIPREMEDQIQNLAKSHSPMRTISQVTSISSDALELLIEKGEASAGWVAETADRPETDTPELMKVKISVHQMYAKPRASQKLLDDSQVNIESWLAEKIADKMISLENAAFINGDGKGQPKGFLSYPSTEVGKGEWGKFEAVKSTIDGGIDEPDVLMDMYYTLKAKYLPGAVWLMPRSTLAVLRKIKGKNGVYMWQPALIAGTPDTLMGHPLYIADDLPALKLGKASVSLAFGDFRAAYQIVDRSNIHILRDPYSAKPYVEFYSTKRVGGDVVNFEAIKLVSFSK